jgi:hypothetical protein
MIAFKESELIIYSWNCGINFVNEYFSRALFQQRTRLELPTQHE